MTCPKLPVLEGKSPGSISSWTLVPHRACARVCGQPHSPPENSRACHLPLRDRRLPLHPLLMPRTLTSAGKERGYGASLGAHPLCPCPSWAQLRRPPGTATWPPCRRCPGCGSGSQGLRRRGGACFYHQCQVGGISPLRSCRGTRGPYPPCRFSSLSITTQHCCLHQNHCKHSVLRAHPTGHVHQVATI